MTDQRMKFGTQAGHAYQELRGRILSGKLQLGENINAQDIANEFGMSRNPIRDALRELSNERLVVWQAGRGWAVRSFSPAELVGAYTVREALEVHSAKLCAERASPEEVDELRRIAERLDASVLRRKAEGPRMSPKHVEHIEMERRFHLAIAEMSGCRELRDEIERSITVLVLALTSLGTVPTQALHGGLVEAIATGDGDLAGKAMSEHINAAVQGVLSDWPDGGPEDHAAAESCDTRAETTLGEAAGRLSLPAAR